MDIAESVSERSDGVQSTLHTTKGCNMKSVKRAMSSKAVGNDCYNRTNQNAGCGVSGESGTFGQAFNTVGGGIYATELRSDGIRILVFPTREYTYRCFHRTGSDECDCGRHPGSKQVG